jgi:hypothetical protein
MFFYKDATSKYFIQLANRPSDKVYSASTLDNISVIPISDIKHCYAVSKKMNILEASSSDIGL